MWPDPSTVKKKPNSLKGTPANKFTALASLGLVITGAALINLIPYVPHFAKKIERVRQETIKFVEDKEVRSLMSDPLIMGAMMRKKNEYEDTAIRDLEME